MSAVFELPPPCGAGLHEPVIVSRCGGDKDPDYENVCGLCGRYIERTDTEPWATVEQREEYNAELRAEVEREEEAAWDEASHPENRCPPRE